MYVFPDGDQGKEAVTHYRVSGATGIRKPGGVQAGNGADPPDQGSLSIHGHPLFHDPEYGGDLILRGTTFTKYKQFVRNCFDLLPGQALHAKTLGFVHPKSGEEMLFEAPFLKDSVRTE